MTSTDVTAPVKYQCTLTAKLLEKAEKELNEKGKWRDRDIQALRDMVLLHKGLKSRTDDAFLLKFLRARKFDYDRAYELLINYYTIRASNADVIGHVSPNSVEHVYNSGCITVLPHKDREGRRIMYFNSGKWNPDEVPMMDFLKTFLLDLEVITLDEESQVCGIVVIDNYDGFTLAHARHFDQKSTKIFTSVLQDAFPLRFKAYHVVNEPSIFGTIWAVIKPFLKEKTVKRTHFHGSSRESLYKHFDVDILPEELGGTLPRGDQLAKNWKAEVLSHKEIFDDFQKYKIELVHEISKARSDDAVQSLSGTYKKLNVD